MKHGPSLQAVPASHPSAGTEAASVTSNNRGDDYGTWHHHQVTYSCASDVGWPSAPREPSCIHSRATSETHCSKGSLLFHCLEVSMTPSGICDSSGYFSTAQELGTAHCTAHLRSTEENSSATGLSRAAASPGTATGAPGESSTPTSLPPAPAGTQAHRRWWGRCPRC